MKSRTNQSEVAASHVSALQLQQDLPVQEEEQQHPLQAEVAHLLQETSTLQARNQLIKERTEGLLQGMEDLEDKYARLYSGIRARGWSLPKELEEEAACVTDG